MFYTLFDELCIEDSFVWLQNMLSPVIFSVDVSRFMQNLLSPWALYLQNLLSPTNESDS